MFSKQESEDKTIIENGVMAGETSEIIAENPVNEKWKQEIEECFKQLFGERESEERTKEWKKFTKETAGNLADEQEDFSYTVNSFAHDLCKSFKWIAKCCDLSTAMALYEKSIMPPSELPHAGICLYLSVPIETVNEMARDGLFLSEDRLEEPTCENVNKPEEEPQRKMGMEFKV